MVRIEGREPGSCGTIRRVLADLLVMKVLAKHTTAICQPLYASSLPQRGEVALDLGPTTMPLSLVAGGLDLAAYFGSFEGSRKP